VSRSDIRNDFQLGEQASFSKTVTETDVIASGGASPTGCSQGG